MSNHSLSSSSCGTIVVHNHLAGSAISRLFEQKQYKIKVSQRVVEDSIIFPQAKLAFLLVKADHVKTLASQSVADWAGGDVVAREGSLAWNHEFLDKMDKLQKRHRHSYVLLQAPLFTSAQFGILLQLQSKYLHTSVDFLPAHNPEECVEAMLTLATVQMSPRCGLLHERYCELMNQHLQPSALRKPRPNATVSDVKAELMRDRCARTRTESDGP